MAQWNHAEKLLYAKLVYYGPAFGGKTTNLETLHRLTDPDGQQRLLSLKTANDRTLFFDLLPFDLGSILGYTVAMKLYTVPGQVRYDTTRQTVLAGADAVVFVADSTGACEELNQWSLQNLRMNMRKAGMDPDKTPVVFQFNKQDKQDAVKPARVAKWLGLNKNCGVPAVATEGHGVLETFVKASREMLLKIYECADARTKERIDAQELARQVERAFKRYHDRELDADKPVQVDEINLEGADLLADAVKIQTDLSERLGDARARMQRQRRELDALRGMSESLVEVGACLDGERVLDAALEAAGTILGAGVVSLIRADPGERTVVEACWGRVGDPLSSSKKGAALLDRMIAAGKSCVVDELHDELDDAATRKPLEGLRAAACVATGDRTARHLLAYATLPDGRFTVEDVRFLRTLGAHLEVGLEQSRLHQEVAAHRDELEKKVEQRTEALRRAYDELREMEQTKDRLLNNLSHEMGSPLTAIIGAATFVRDYQSDAEQRAESIRSVLASAEKLRGQLDQLLRLADLNEASGPRLAETTPEELVEAAVSLCDLDGIETCLTDAPEVLRLDLALVARAVGNLLENAVKFSPPDTPVELEVRCEGDGVSVVVSDSGAGVAEGDRERIFAPFEQGGEPLTDKPAGVGMGLYEASVIAKRHGGSLKYEERKSGGSRFVLYLPGDRAGARERDLEVAHA